MSLVDYPTAALNLRRGQPTVPFVPLRVDERGTDREHERRRSSVWPPVAALGIVATETGVLFGRAVVAVSGIAAVGVSCAGMLRETGYASDPWRPLRFIGALIAIVGAAVWITLASAIIPAGLVAAAVTDGVAARAAVVLGGAVVLILAGVAGPVVTRRGSTTDRDLKQ